MFCDKMDVEKPQRVPLSVFRHCETLAPQNFRFSTTVKEYLTLGSLFAIFEPWIWRRLGPVPACLTSIVAKHQNKQGSEVSSVSHCKSRQYQNEPTNKKRTSKV